MNETQELLVRAHRRALEFAKATGLQRAMDLLYQVTIELLNQGVVYMGDGTYVDYREVGCEDPNCPCKRTLN